MIEDETHFLFECKKNDSIRKHMCKIIKDSIIVLGSYNTCVQENLINFKLFNCIDVLAIKAIWNFLEQSTVV